jgi:Fe2+ or Zn2+ uptake regulation protein
MQRLHLETAGASFSAMTAHPQRRLLDQLRARGIRLTSQRTILMNILDAADGFVDVATLCALARRKGARVDRATVYRTLALLRSNGLLAARDGAADWAPSASSADRAPGTPVAVAHDELGLVCEQCGTRQPVAAEAPDSIKKELQRCTGFDARAVRLQASGECRLCAAKGRLRTRPKDRPRP